MTTAQARKLLIVEDSILIAMDLEYRVRELADFEVSIATSVGAALAGLDRERPDLAILDFRMSASETSEPVARRLAAEGIPFLIISGNGEEARARLGDAPAVILDKPATDTMLEGALRTVDALD